MCELVISMVLFYMKIKWFVKYFVKEKGNIINLFKYLYVRIKYGIDIKFMFYV